MRITVIQLAYGDDESVNERTKRVADLVRKQEGADLVVLPELWSAGAFDADAWEQRAQTMDGAVPTAMSQAARDAGVVLHAGSIIERSERPGPEGKRLWNTSLVFDRDGSLVTSYRKIHRFAAGGVEREHLEGGDTVSIIELTPAAGPGAYAAGSDPTVSIPMGGGDVLAPLRAGLSTCYDLRFPELYRMQVDAGATMFLLPAAWPQARARAWKVLTSARAIEDQCLMIACNTAGTHAGTPMAGRSRVVMPDGEVLAEAGEQQQVLHVEVDPAAITRAREKFPVLRDRRLF